VWEAAVDYGREDRKSVGGLKGDLGAIIRSVLTLPLFKTSRSSPPKKHTVQPRDAFEDTAYFKPEFEFVSFLTRF
jgi:hypothetical protein